MKKQLTKMILTVSGLIMASSVASAVPFLCKNNEDQIFSCAVKHQGESKSAVVCADKNSFNVTYRFSRDRDRYEEKTITIDAQRYGATKVSGREIGGGNNYELAIKFEDGDVAYEVNSDEYGAAGINILQNDRDVGRIDCIGGEYFDQEELQRAFPLSGEEQFDRYTSSSQSYSHGSSQQQSQWLQPSTQDALSRAGTTQAKLSSYILGYLVPYTPAIQQELLNVQKRGDVCQAKVYYDQITNNTVDALIACTTSDGNLETSQIVLSFVYNSQKNDLDLVGVRSERTDY